MFVYDDKQDRVGIMNRWMQSTELVVTAPDLEYCFSLYLEYLLQVFAACLFKIAADFVVSF